MKLHETEIKTKHFQNLFSHQLLNLNLSNAYG